MALKFSSCLTHPSVYRLGFEEQLKTFIEFGFDAVDLPGDSTRYSPKKVMEIYESYKDKIKLAEVTAMVNPNRDLINPDEKLRESAKGYIKECIDLATETGVNLTHFCFITSPDNLNNPREKLYGLAADVIKELYMYAEDRNVVLMIEPLFKGDNSIINTIPQAVAIYSDALGIDQEVFLSTYPKAGILMDFFHMKCEESDFMGSLETYLPKTFHIHIADEIRSLKFEDGKTGYLREAFGIIKKSEYEGYISFETFFEGLAPADFGKALKKIKKWC